MRSIISSLLGVTMVRFSLLAENKTLAECFCNDYSLHSYLTHTYVFLYPSENTLIAVSDLFLRCVYLYQELEGGAASSRMYI